MDYNLKSPRGKTLFSTKKYKELKGCFNQDLCTTLKLSPFNNYKHLKEKTW